MLELLFNGLPAASAVLMVAAAGAASFITASLGVGGGVMLLGIMAQALPPQLIIPLHGIVQLGSNGGRAAMSWRHIDWGFFRAFLPGAIVGATLASLVLITLDPAIMYLTIASFILYLCWGPKLHAKVLGTLGRMTLGMTTTFLTLFVGATGPLVVGFISQLYNNRFQTIATFATVMSFQHICKIIVFESTGVDLIPWLPLLSAMVISGALGTFLGLRVLKRLPEHHFKNIFNLLLTLLACRLLWQAFVLLTA